MGGHPINLAARFFLELAALGAMGYWGWAIGSGPWRFVLAIGAPLIGAVLWGTFAVPDDPSRSGRAPVAVPGLVRLALEWAIFGFATWALYRAGQPRLSLIFGLLVVIHYVLSYDRMAWLGRR